MTMQNDLAVQSVPRYGLYGEPLQSSPVLMHIEPIEARTRALNGEISIHIHQNLHQITWLASGQLEVQVNGHRRTLSGPAAVIVPAPHSAFLQSRDKCRRLRIDGQAGVFPLLGEQGGQ